MRILFVFECEIVPENGGVERVTMLLAEGLSRRGHNVEFLSVGTSAENKIQKTHSGFHQTVIPSSIENFDQEIVSFFKRIKADAIILQGMNNKVVDLLPLIPEGIRKFQTYHLKPFGEIPYERYIRKAMFWSTMSWQEKVKKIMALISPAFYRALTVRKISSRFVYIAEKVDKLVFLSPRFLPRVIRYSKGIDVSKLAAINNPLTFTIPEEVDHHKENLVIFVARLVNGQKNVTGFIDVWVRFRKSHPDWKAYIIGTGPDEVEVRRYARKKKAEGLIFTGKVRNVEDYYRKAKILCMTSTLEGWGMVLTEAMAYGCVPVAYESYEAVTDIIDSGQNGLLVKPFKTSEMVDALTLLADDEVLRQRLAQSGMDKIRMFETANIVEKWEKLLTSI